MGELEDLQKAYQALMEEARRYGELTPKDKSKILREIEQDILRRARDIERRINALKGGWRAGLRANAPRILRGGVYLALAYLLVAAVVDSRVKPPKISGGNGPCAINAGRTTMTVNPSATGPNGALRDALAELATKCNASALACGGTSCPTCGPDVAVQTVDIKCRVFWYTAEVTAICQCYCK